MPIVGLNRKAKPIHIYEAIDYGDWPKPSKHETFSSFLNRVSDDEYITKILMRIGYGEPTRGEYERRLDDLRDEFHRIYNRLYEILRRN